MPNSTFIKSTHTAELDLPTIPLTARHAHIFHEDDLLGSLLSIGALCDAGLKVIYDKTKVTAYDTHDTTVLQGYRDPTTNLWMISLDKADQTSTAPTTLTAAAATMSLSQRDRVAYWHAALGSPSPTAWLKAMANGYMTIHGLKRDMILKHPPNSMATPKGHLDRTRQGQRSTKPQTDFETASFPQTSTASTTLDCPVQTKLWTMTGQQYTDLTGRFPVASYSGKQYIMVMYNADANYIHIEAMTSRRASDFVAAYANGVAFFSKHGLKPIFERLDNETSTALTSFCETNNITIQYVPPHNHRANKAERAIRTFKNHFVAMLCTTHPSFPLQAWEHLLPQAEITVNLLRGSNLDPTKSAWENLHRQSYDFDKHPIAPVSTQVIAFEGPEQRSSWAPHGIEGFYTGPALQHYRCYTVFIPRTVATRVVDTLTWHPTMLPMPTLDTGEMLGEAIALLQRALTIMANDPTLQQATTSVSGETITKCLTQIDAIIKMFHTTSTAQPLRTAAQPAIPTQNIQAEEQRVEVPATGEQRVEVPATGKQRVEAPTIADQTWQDHATRPIIDPTAQPPPGFEQDQQQCTTAPAVKPSITYAEYNRRRRLKPTLRTTPMAPLPSQQTTQQTVPPPIRPQRSRRPNQLYINQLLQQATLMASGALPANTTTMTHTVDPTRYDAALRGPDRDIWETAACTEIDRLIESGTGRFIHMSDKPADRKASYYNPQIRVKHKEDGTTEYRVRGTYGGDQSDYTGPVSAATAALPTIKLLLNAVASEDASWMTIDIKDFYLGTPLPNKEYMRITLKHIPLAAQIKHNVTHYAKQGSVMMEINKGIYGLPQAGKLAQDQLLAHLALHGYNMAPNTLPIAFTLVVDDFGIKYHNKDSAQHLIDTLEKLYIIKIIWTGSKYVGLTIAHDKVKRAVRISMPGYVEKALQRFGILHSKGVDSPSEFVAPHYGTHEQYTEIDESPTIAADRAKRIQQIVGVFLFYARAVDPTMLVSVSKLGSQQARPTEAVAAAAERLLHYAAKYPNASIVFHASDMRLLCHSDASYLSESHSRSRAGGILYLGTYDNDTAINGTIDSISIIIPVTVSSAAEAEYAAAFLVRKEAEVPRNALLDLGYPQPATTIICDNKCAVGLANNSVKQKRSKAMDMRFHWLRDRVAQKHFVVIWREGKYNIADYLTKVHPIHHFRDMRSYFVQDYFPE